MVYFLRRGPSFQAVASFLCVVLDQATKPLYCENSMVEDTADVLFCFRGWAFWIVILSIFVSFKIATKYYFPRVFRFS